jgi:uncharacterized membrane protein YdjX (TVP38/TMEM64 family)
VKNLISSKIFTSAIVVILYLGIFLLFYLWSAPIDYLEELTRDSIFLGPFAFIFLAFLVVVVAPLTIVPLIPVASVIFGPFWAGLYTIIGWFLGSIVDFIIARKFGKPLIKKFISLETVEKYENYIPRQMEFWWVVLLRIIIQVDILSYALGLFSRISLWKYSLATLIGMMPMAFIFSYAGSALLMRDFQFLMILAVVFTVVFVGLSYVYYKKGGVRDEIEEEVKMENYV